MLDLNVLGGNLRVCSCDPMTGYFRDGSCRTDDTDHGLHTVCVKASLEFLEFSKLRGNDLSTPNADFGFPGLKPDDHWCLCALRWLEAYEAGCAPLVDLEATHINTLRLIPLEVLEGLSLYNIEPLD